jgi:acyl-CoA thioesterase-2
VDPTPARQQPDLTSTFDLERLDERTWLGSSDDLDLPQMFGGQLIGQSIIAGGRSVGDELRVHSSHTTFLRPGTVGQPIRYAVEELVSGRRRAACEVSAWQDERLLCRTIVSASLDADGVAHARPAPTPRVADAVPLAVLAEADGGLGVWWHQFDSLEVRVSPTAEDPEQPDSTVAPTLVWMRAAERLPEDPLVHRAAIAFASDLMLIATAAAVHGVPVGHERTMSQLWWGISLDHSMWFHDRVRADEWVVFEQVTPMAHAGRTLIQAAAFDEAGAPVCQVAQEALLRRQR